MRLAAGLRPDPKRNLTALPGRPPLTGFKGMVRKVGNEQNATWTKCPHAPAWGMGAFCPLPPAAFYNKFVCSVMPVKVCLFTRATLC